jgi:anti-sigma factor RsiW
MKQRHPDVALAVYAAGRLEPGERAEMERHLERCPVCRAVVADYRAILHRLATAAPPVPDVAWPRYQAEVRVRRARRSWRQRWLRPIPVAVTAAVAAAGAIVVFAIAPGTPPPADLTSIEYEGLASRMEMIDQYRVVEQLDLLEDLDVIRNLDRLTPTRDG